MALRGEPIRAILTTEEEESLVAAIGRAEAGTSAEIRVHVEARAGGDPLATARRWFHHLRMDRTALHNGVLIYLAVQDHAFAIVGDSGIHEKVGDARWEALRDDLQSAFARGAFVEGLEGAVAAAGALLAEHFPRSGDDRNELPDTVSR